MREIPGKCRRVQRDIVAYLDGELTERRRGRVTVHLEQCARCRNELEGFRRVGELIEGLPELEVEESRQRELLAELRGGIQFAPLAASWGWRIPAAAVAVAAACLLVWQAGMHYSPAPVEVVPRKTTEAGGNAEVTAEGMKLAAKKKDGPQGGVLEKRGQGYGPKVEPPAKGLGDERLLAAFNKTPPPVLFEKPDLFLDFPILQDLDKLENFEAVLQASPAVERGYGEGSRAGHG